MPQKMRIMMTISRTTRTNLTITKYQIMMMTMKKIMMMRNTTTKKTMRMKITMMTRKTMRMMTKTKMIVAGDHEAEEEISSVTAREDLHPVEDVLDLEAAHVLVHGAEIPDLEVEHPEEDLHL